MANYWTNREAQARYKLLTKSIEETQAVTQKLYYTASKSILTDMLRVYNKIMSEETPQLSHLYSYNKYYEMLNKVNNKIDTLGNKEEHLLDERLKKLYLANQKIIGPLSPMLNEAKVEKAVREIWLDDGMGFSDRIWSNKSALTENLKNCLIDGITAGKSSDRLTADLMQRMNVGYNEAKRLVATEMSHVSAVSTLDKYGEAGIKYYRVLSEPNCCDTCTDENSDVYPISDKDHLPPYHPYCKCTILAII